MKAIGIMEGDIVIVDKSQEPKHRNIIVASVDGEFTIKTFVKEKGRVILKPENPEYKPIHITDQELIIWGVVTGIARRISNAGTD